MSRVFALIPARAGSKGVPGKNLRTLGGKTLIEHAVTCAVAVGAWPVVSTDIAAFFDGDYEMVIHTGRDSPSYLRRPPDLASDAAAMVDVVRHALSKTSGPPDQIVLLLQPTAPFRKPEHLTAAIALLQASGADSVVSVVPLPLTHSPDLVCEIEPSGRLAGWGHECVGVYQPTRRQEARPAYIRDGTVYAFRRQTVARGTLYGRDCRPLILDPADSCEMDTESDWAEVERRWAARHGASA